MKSKSYLGISFIVLIFAILVVPKIISRIENNQVLDNDRLNYGINKSENTKSDLVIIGAAPDFELTNQYNQKTTLARFKNKVTVVEFFFSTCPTICPKMNANMLVLQDFFKAESDFAIASITINPQHDTPEVLLAHAEHLGVTNPNWLFLTGDRDYIMNIANKGYNLYAAQNENVAGGFEHSGMFALLDKQGRIRCRKDDFGNPILYYDGIEQSGIEQLKQDINKLLQE